MGKTTTDIINSIKRRGSFPTSDTTFSNTDFLTILDEEMQNTILPLFTMINEDYFIEYQDESIVANQDLYRINKRAMGVILRDVQLVDSNNAITSLVRLYEEDKTSTTNNEQGYFLKGNRVQLSPKPTSAAGTLRLVYFRRPSQYVLTSACAEITSIDTATNSIVVSSLPSTMTSNVSIDFVQAESPYDILSMDSVILGVSGTTVTFSALPDDLVEGDYICLSGQTCVAGIPDEILSILIQASLCVCLSSKKDSSVKLVLDKLERMKENFLELLLPRVKSDDKKIINKNGLLSYFRGY